MVDSSRTTVAVRHGDASLWHEVEAGFWVGSRTGQFLGTIERHRDRFFARDCVGASLGVYPSVEAACCVLDSDRKPKEQSCRKQ
ncbi:hypothetical protein GCM10009776_28690 [Microbacterium deminutum]|uniref:Uncharacterized protein n=2 Tax=Microbacterium deminutum TaxID=344164 RepID=A0ABN2R5V9_9MICO